MTRKAIFTLISFLLLCCFLSCRKPVSYPPLLQADSLLETDLPDSARHYYKASPLPKNGLNPNMPSSACCWLKAVICNQDINFNRIHWLILLWISMITPTAWIWWEPWFVKQTYRRISTLGKEHSSTIKKPYVYWNHIPMLTGCIT